MLRGGWSLEKGYDLHINEVKNNQFYQFPKWLLTEPYKKLGDKAKLMYMLLFDRRSLSVKNKWYDRDGKIYLYFTNEQFMQEIGCSEPAVIKAKKELIDVGLLQEVRQGINKPNRLYINGTKESLGQELKFFKSGTKESLGQELNKVKGINTDVINTNISNNKDDNSGLGFGQFLKAEGLEASEVHLQRLLEYVGIDGMDFNVVKLAVSLTTEQGIKAPKYTFAILDNWKEQGVLHLDEALEAQRKFKEQKKSKKTNSNTETLDSGTYQHELPF